MNEPWRLAAVPLLIALNAFFVVSEYAVVAARPGQIQAIRARGGTRAAAAMERLKANPASAIGAIQVCITMTNLLLGWIGEPAMSALIHRLFGPLIRLFPLLLDWSATALSFIVVTLLTVVFSELLPKAMTLRYVETAAAWTAGPVLAIQRAIYPLVWLMNKTANAVTVPLGLGRVEQFEGQQVTRDELKLMALQAAEDGVVTPRERSLILRSLAIGKRPAKQVMVPRIRVAFLDLRKSMAENREVMDRYLFSRLPLCDGGMDRVVGVVHTKEFLTAYFAEGDTSVLSLIAEPPVFLPEGVSLDELLNVFRRRRTQIAFLVDEYGGVEGVVTLRDLVDELLGEPTQHAPAATSQADADARPGPAAEPPGQGPLVVPGDTPIHELARRMGRDEWAADARTVTVGGAVVAAAQRVPAAGEEVAVDGVRLRVVDSDGRAVRRVEVMPQASDPAGDGGGGTAR